MGLFSNTKILIVGLLILVLFIALIFFLNPRGSDVTQPSIPIASISPDRTDVEPSPTTPSTSIEDQLKAQNEDDIKTGQYEAAIRKKYPWYDKLPIFEKNIYFVYFDLETEKLIGKLYITSSTTTEQQEQLKQSILTQLSQLGIDLASYSVNWQIIKS